MKLPARSTAQGRDSGGWVVRPSFRCADDISMDLPLICFPGKQIEVTLRFQTRNNVGESIGGFRPADGSEWYGEASFDAKYR